MPSQKPLILYVDDEEQNRKYFQKEHEGEYRVLAAANSDEAEKVLQRQGSEISVVVSDLRMPGKDGIAFLSRVRKFWPDKIRVIMTAYADNQSAIDAVNKCGVFKFLSKPCEPEEVSEVLSDAVDLHHEVDVRSDEHRVKELRNSVVELKNFLHQGQFHGSTG